MDSAGKAHLAVVWTTCPLMRRSFVSEAIIDHEEEP
jgi:hypothetical protein